MDIIGHNSGTWNLGGDPCLTQGDKDRVSYGTEGVPIGRNWQGKARLTPQQTAE